MENHFKGSCLCGKVTYDCNAEPLVKAVCHCTDCQKHTSSAFSVVIGVPKSKFKVNGDTVKNIPITTDTGNTKRYSFCSECGSHLFSNIEHEKYNEITFIKGGSLDQPTLADITPDLEVFTESKVKWANYGNLGASFPKNPE